MENTDKKKKNEHKKDKTEKDKQNEKLDEELKETFPASDASSSVQPKRKSDKK